MATFSRLKREKVITGRQFATLKEELFQDLRDMTIIAISPATVQNSILAIERSALKALDAAHIGCALECAPDFFVSSDTQQLNAAKAMGLKVRAI
jgi:hypothetical protein